MSLTRTGVCAEAENEQTKSRRARDVRMMGSTDEAAFYQESQPAWRGRRPRDMRRTMLLLMLLALSTGAAWRRGDAYVLHFGKSDVTLRWGSSIAFFVGLQKRLGGGSYLWTRIDGREYVIRDEAFLRDADALWAPAHALKPEEKALAAEERRPDPRIDAIEDGKATGEPGELQRLRERDRAVSARMRELEQRMDAMEKEIEAKLGAMVEQAIRDGRPRPMR